MHRHALRWLLILLSLAAGAPAHADLSSPYYFGARGGFVRAGVDAGDLTRELNRQGHSVSARVDGSAAAGELYFGKMIEPRVGLEASLRWLGEFPVRLSGSTSLGEAALARDVLEEGPKGGYAAGFAARGHFRLGSRNVTLVPRGGLLLWRQDREVRSSSDTRDEHAQGVGVMLGLGVDLRLTGHWVLGLGGEAQRLDSRGINRGLYGQMEYRW